MSLTSLTCYSPREKFAALFFALPSRTYMSTQACTHIHTHKHTHTHTHKHTHMNLHHPQAKYLFGPSYVQASPPNTHTHAQVLKLSLMTFERSAFCPTASLGPAPNTQAHTSTYTNLHQHPWKKVCLCPHNSHGPAP